MNPIDIFVQRFFLHIRTEWVTDFIYMVSRIFDVSVYSILVTVLIAILIYLMRGNKYSLLFLYTMFAGAVISYILKILFNVARPTQPVFNAFGPSFPSYHAVIVTIFFVMSMYIFDGFFKGIFRKVFNFLCIFGIFLVSLSRIYLGVHWLSDVCGGIILGLLICYSSIRISNKRRYLSIKT